MTLIPNGYLPRLIEKKVELGLKAGGAVCIEGPKFCGKTWCARKFAESEFSLVDPADNFNNRTIAELNPTSTLKGKQPHLIDEWQEVPKIWDAVRYTVDLDGQHGKFILCGSSSYDKSNLMHSGAGRIISIRMKTMSLFESKDSSGCISLNGLFENKFQENIMSSPAHLQDLIWYTIRGGWPNNLGADEKTVRLRLTEYINRICETDALKINEKRLNVSNLKRTFRSLARNECTLASISKIASDISEYESERIEESTVSGYTNLLDRLFLRSDLSAFSPNHRSSLRVGKSPKRRFVDPSLAAAALQMGSEELISDLNTFGFLFESLCERDLQIYAEYSGGSVYHYRDYDGREIDAIVELPGKGWGAFEIKLGANAIDTAAKNLLKIKNKMEETEPGSGPLFLCVLYGVGGAAYRRDDGVYVVPITMLGP